MAIAIEAQIQSLLDIIEYLLIKLNVATVLDLKTILEESMIEIISIKNSFSEAQLYYEDLETSNFRKRNDSFQSDIPREENVIQGNNEVLILSKDDIPIIDIGIMNKSDSLEKDHSKENANESVCNISEFSSISKKENDILDDHWVDVKREYFEVSEFNTGAESTKINEEDVGESKTMHKQVKKEELSVCNICGKNYRNRKDMNNHVRRYHDDTVHQCVKCFKKIKGKKNFREHMRIHNPKVECSLCHKIFQEVSIKKHMRDNCIYGPQLKKMKKPKKEHKNYICQTCDLNFSDRRQLRAHRKKTHLVSVKCQNCSKTFRKQKNLEMHIERIHILPKLKVPKDRYKYCDLCEYKSLQRLNVKRHMVVHTRSRPRVNTEKVCDNCGYQFRTPINLRRHKKMNRCRKDLSDKDKTLILTWTGN